MPQADEWKPEHGDDDWWPDPARAVESYQDTELRFLPIYRQVRRMMPGASDQELLAACRQVLSGFLTDDEENKPKVKRQPRRPKLRILS